MTGLGNGIGLSPSQEAWVFFRPFYKERTWELTCLKKNQFSLQQLGLSLSIYVKVKKKEETALLTAGRGEL